LHLLSIFLTLFIMFALKQRFQAFVFKKTEYIDMSSRMGTWTLCPDDACSCQAQGYEE